VLHKRWFRVLKLHFVVVAFERLMYRIIWSWE